MLKVIRFTKNSSIKHEPSLKELRMQGWVVIKSRPYIGMIDANNKIVACIWKDDEREISIITDKKYRGKGLMRILLTHMKDDVFKGRLKYLSAEPLNKTSLKVLRKNGFMKCENGGYIFELE